MRIYGVTEGDNNGSQGGEETEKECEKKILFIIRDRLKVDVRKEEIEAVHRFGRKQQKDTPSGIIVRFVPWRVDDSVIRAHRNLRKSGIATVEDLTPRAYSLLWTVKDDTSVCKEAWSKNGKNIYESTEWQNCSGQDLV